MKWNHNDTRGMTLVEIILAIMILSIAMMIIYTGFVSAANILSSSKQYTNAVQLQKETLLEGNGEVSEAKVTITQDGNMITIEGEYQTATDGDSQGVLPFIKFNEK